MDSPPKRRSHQPEAADVAGPCPAVRCTLCWVQAIDCRTPENIVSRTDRLQPTCGHFITKLLRRGPAIFKTVGNNLIFRLVAPQVRTSKKQPGGGEAHAAFFAGCALWKWKGSRRDTHQTPFLDLHPTAGVTGKRGMWRIKPPDAESAAWGQNPESAANGPHLSGARGVGPFFAFRYLIALMFCSLFREPNPYDFS